MKGYIFSFIGFVGFLIAALVGKEYLLLIPSMIALVAGVLGVIADKKQQG